MRAVSAPQPEPLLVLPGYVPPLFPGPVLDRIAIVSLSCLHLAVVARLGWGAGMPWPVSVLAVVAVIAVPARLVSWKVKWVQAGRAEGVIYGLALTILGLMIGGLLLNTVLPVVGVARPLDPLPVVVTFDAALAALVVWRRDRHPRPRRVLTLRVPVGRLDVVVGGLAVTSLFGVFVGATRLNNGAGGEVTVVALILIAGVWGLLLRYRLRLHQGTVYFAIYVVGLGLLAMTSMRGWFITGHDIQREFRLFSRVLTDGSWDIATFRDPYNACLSVTVLPTVVRNLTGLDPVYVMKLVPVLVFAACPVAVYLLAERFVSRSVSLLGTLTFVAFPTYFSDMPFLTRQEYAFLFLAAGLLVMTNLQLGVVRRRILFGVFGSGIVLAHYSTTYVFLAVLMLSVLTHVVLRASNGILPPRLRWLNRSDSTRTTRARDVKLVIGFVNVAVLLLMTTIWSQVVTDTNGQLTRTLTASISGLLHPGDGAGRSSDTRYNLFGGGAVDPAVRLGDYRKESLADTAQGRADGGFLPLALVGQAPTPPVDEEEIPLTRLGSAATDLGIDVTAVNGIVRGVSARLLQVFVAIGMVAVLFGYRRRIRATSELTILAGASFAVVLSQVILPQLSVDYGVLRAFQQSLFLLAPFLAVGMIVTFSFLKRFATMAASGFALVFMVSLTGVLPQLTGGYPPQLHLNNAGQYYDIYYTRPGEVLAASWTLGEIRQEGMSVDRNLDTDRYTFQRVQVFTDLETGGEIFPTRLRTASYVVVSTSVVTRAVANVGYGGDTLAYRYPFAVLDAAKDLVYSNGEADVYR